MGGQPTEKQISIPAILAGQRDDGPGQRVLVVPLRGLIVCFRQACVVADTRFNSWGLCRDDERVRASG